MTRNSPRDAASMKTATVGELMTGGMLWPGNEAYSLAQGESNDKPGAIAGDAGRVEAN